MPEEMTKLFASRAERFPEPDDSDLVYRAAEKSLEQIPAIGAIITFVATHFLGPSFERRRTEWFKELATAFDELERKDHTRFQRVLEDEAFLTAVFEASRVAVSTHQAAKREVLKNALLNIALGLCPEDDRQHMYLRLIDQLTPSHMRVLRFLHRGNIDWHRVNHGQPPPFVTNLIVLQSLEPDLVKDQSFYDVLVRDLNYIGIANAGMVNESFPGSNLPNNGLSFLRFITRPEDLP